MSDYSLDNNELVNILSKIDLDSNKIDSLDLMNYLLNPLLNLNKKGRLTSINGILNIGAEFNPLPRRVPVILHNRSVSINFLSLLNTILCYNLVSTTRFSVQLIAKLGNLTIELPFLDYDEYYKIYEKDYLKYMAIPQEMRDNFKFKSIVTYIP